MTGSRGRDSGGFRRVHDVNFEPKQSGHPGEEGIRARKCEAEAGGRSRGRNAAGAKAMRKFRRARVGWNDRVDWIPGAVSRRSARAPRNNAPLPLCSNRVLADTTPASSIPSFTATRSKEDALVSGALAGCRCWGPSGRALPVAFAVQRAAGPAISRVRVDPPPPELHPQGREHFRLEDDLLPPADPVEADAERKDERAAANRYRTSRTGERGVPQHAERHERDPRDPSSGSAPGELSCSFACTSRP